MNALLQWIDDRTGLLPALRKCFDRPLVGKACWCKVWPTTILFAFGMQAITGFFLWAYYSPSAQTAWESVYFLQYHVPGGWLLRAMHHYSAHVLLAMLIVYVVQTIVSGAYRAPREFVFWTALGMALCALAAVLTGDLLSWDRNGYASTLVRTSFLTLLPGVGESLLRLAIGGPPPALGHLTLTRFFALHAGLFSAAFLLLLVLHRILARRADAKQADTAGGASGWWPHQAWRNAVACLLVLVIVLLLSCQHGVKGDQAGVTLGSPADTNPAGRYEAARPEWFLLGVYEFSHLFPGQWAVVPIFVVPGLLLGLLLAMPFIGRGSAGQKFNIAITAMVLIATSVLSYRSLAKDAADRQQQAAIAVERKQAERIRQLIAHEGIPGSGALSLLQKDPRTQGPKLFRQQCASCHNYLAEDGDDMLAEKSSAPDLHGFATRAWIAGILDPQQHGGPQYFGNTKFSRGRMLGFLKELWRDAERDKSVADLKGDLRKAAAALSAEAHLISQRTEDARDAKFIEEGRLLIKDTLGCTTCHKFYDKGTLGSAPDLTHYGSRPWLLGVTANPADRQFYGNKNDRMPAFGEILSARDLGLLTEWLRGEWWTGD